MSLIKLLHKHKFNFQKPKILLKLLKSKGFTEIGRKGSHIRLKHSDGRWTQIAIHPILTLGKQRRIDIVI